MEIGLKKNMVNLVKHSPDWLILFENEKNELVKLIGDNTVEIYHIGSTSIPGIYAKPIIDVLILLNTYEKIQIVKVILENSGYIISTFRPRDHFLFKKEHDEISTHYLHLLNIKDDWQRYLLFRDYLINNPNLAEEYQSLKILLAEKYSTDRIQYTAMKNDFIEKIILNIRKSF